MRANESDWIIKGVKGELYPCKPDIFEQTYTQAPDHAEALAEALRPFVEGYAHTRTFLETREKMHQIGRDLYAEEVYRARQALAAYEASKEANDG